MQKGILIVSARNVAARLPREPTRPRCRRKERRGRVEHRGRRRNETRKVTEHVILVSEMEPFFHVVTTAAAAALNNRTDRGVARAEGRVPQLVPRARRGGARCPFRVDPRPNARRAARAVEEHVPLDPAARPVVQVSDDVDGVLDGLLPLPQRWPLQRRLRRQEGQLWVLAMHLFESAVVVEIISVPVKRRAVHVLRTVAILFF